MKLGVMLRDQPCFASILRRKRFLCRYCFQWYSHPLTCDHSCSTNHLTTDVVTACYVGDFNWLTVIGCFMPPRISDAEWEIMSEVWSRGCVTAAEVIAELGPRKGWNHRTIRTLLARLVEKGALTSVQDGNRYEYRARVNRKTCVRQHAKSFLEKVFGGDAGRD